MLQDKTTIYSARPFLLLLAIVVQCYTPVGAQQPTPAAPCVIAFPTATLWAPSSSDGEGWLEWQHGAVMLTATPKRPGIYYGTKLSQIGVNLSWTGGPHSAEGEKCATTQQWSIQTKPGDIITNYGDPCQTYGGSFRVNKIVLVAP